MSTILHNSFETNRLWYPTDKSWIDEASIDFSDGDFDSATTHVCNAYLRTHEIVRGFFNDVKQLKSLEDSSTVGQLAELPIGMDDLVIPLFEDIDSATDYQLHPSFTNLNLGESATNPDPDIFYLSVDGERIPLDDPERPQLVMGRG